MARHGGWDSCPNRRGWKAYDVTDDYRTFPVTCGSNSCPYCLETNVWRFGLAMAHSAPSRYAVLTGIPSTDWQANRKALTYFWRILERADYHLRAWYCFEHNPTPTPGVAEAHLNIWWWGPDVPQGFLSEACERTGWGSVVDVRRFKARREIRYGMKEAVPIRYGMKEAIDQVDEDERSFFISDSARAYLELNGGHLMNARRGQHRPWRDGVGGPQLSGLRETLRAYWGLEGRRSECVVTRNGEIPGSRDYAGPLPASVTPPAMTGTSESAPVPPSTLSSAGDLSGSNWVSSTLWSPAPAPTT